MNEPFWRRITYVFLGAGTSSFACSGAAAISRSGEEIRMMIKSNGLATFHAAVISLLSGATLYAGTIVTRLIYRPTSLSPLCPAARSFMTPSRCSAPQSTRYRAPNFCTSRNGVNASGRSTNIAGAFASSLAESDGNGGVGVSQLIFGTGGCSRQDAIRQLVAQSYGPTPSSTTAPRHTICCT